MKKLDEHSKWDREWKEAFEDASQAPPAHVWNNIHAVQANKEADKFRKRAFYYKWVAAASVLISICSAGIFLLKSDFNREQADNTLPKQHEVNDAQSAKPTADNEGIENPFEIAATEDSGDNITETSVDASEPEKARRKYKKGNSQSGTSHPDRNTIAFAPPKVAVENSGNTSGPLHGEENNPEAIATPNIERSDSGDGTLETLPPVGLADGAGEQLAFISTLGEDEASGYGSTYPSGKNVDITLSSRGPVPLKVQEADGVSGQIRKVWVASNFYNKNKSKAEPKYMLGATLASNNFNANYLDRSPEMASFASNPQDLMAKPSPLSNARVTDWDEEQSSTMSMTGGLQAAAWLSKRWVLQGGVLYGNYKSSSQASSYDDPGGMHSYPLHFANYSAEKAETASFGRSKNSASQISATNSYEFVSVPLSIGYVVLDRKISVLLAPGVSSEFFLSNTISAKQESNISPLTVSNGDDSPFNTVHFRGLMNVQLFYKIGQNYVISLEPGFQQAITDFNKTDSFFSSRPSNVSMAAGFRYIFR